MVDSVDWSLVFTAPLQMDKDEVSSIIAGFERQERGGQRLRLNS
jgi:hypothetical protein